MSAVIGGRVDAEPVAPDSLAPATVNLRADFLESNARALGIDENLVAQLRATPRRARVRKVGDGAALEFEGRLLGAPLDATSESRTLGAVSDSDDVVVVFGLGLGDLAVRARERARGKVIVYEPDLGLLRCALEYGPLSLGETQVVTDREHLMAAWPRSASKPATASLLCTSGYIEAFPDEHAALNETVVEARLNQALFSNTYRGRGRDWVDNLLANLPLLAEHVPFAALAGAFEGVPAFIVGAGPSLSKNVEHLAAAAERGLVFATNSSTRTLARHGIEPQVVTCLEAADMSTVLSEAPFIDRAIRAFSMTAHPDTLRCGAGPLLPVWEDFSQVTGVLSALTELPALSVSASVSTLSVSLAILLGCNPIVLVGHDLAYTGGRMYSQGSQFAESSVEVDPEKGTVRLVFSERLREARSRAAGPNGPQEVEHLCLLPAWGGDGTVPSGPTFVPVRNWFSQIAALAGTTSFVNATEGGARIDGFHERTLDSIVAELPRRRITSADIAELAARVGTRTDSGTILSWARDQRRRVRKVMAAALALERTVKNARRAMKSEDPSKIRSAFAALETAESRLQQAGRAIPLFSIWSAGQVGTVLENQSPAAGQKNEVELSIAKEQRVARAIASNARELEEALNRLLRRD